jgi:hypothetical protein
MKEPFYGIFLSTLNRLETREVEIAGVRKNGINMEIGINPDRWPELSYNLRYGILKHELLHVCFFHPTMRDRYSDKKVFNIAADIEVNQYIEDKWKEGGGFLHHDMFDLPPKMGTDWYYKELMQMKGNNEALDNLLDNMSQNYHDWKQIEDSSEHEKKLMDKQVQHQMSDAAKLSKNRGVLPGNIQDAIDAYGKLEEAVIDWKAFLRRFSGHSTKYYTKKSKRKESNRFEGSPGLKIKHRNHIFVAVDTSGSVSAAEFNEFMDQIHHIHKSGTEVTIGHADSGMAHVEKYKGQKLRDRYGNGGTDFDPAIEYFNQHKSLYTSMVYFTDGECMPPSIKPHKPMLWVISSSGHKLESLPGLQIQITKK